MGTRYREFACESVCMREREYMGERERVCVCVCVCAYDRERERARERERGELKETKKEITVKKLLLTCRSPKLSCQEYRQYFCG